MWYQCPWLRRIEILAPVQLTVLSIHQMGIYRSIQDLTLRLLFGTLLYRLHHVILHMINSLMVCNAAQYNTIQYYHGVLVLHNYNYTMQLILFSVNCVPYHFINLSSTVILLPIYHVYNSLIIVVIIINFKAVFAIIIIINIRHDQMYGLSYDSIHNMPHQ